MEKCLDEDEIVCAGVGFESEMDVHGLAAAGLNESGKFCVEG